MPLSIIVFPAVTDSPRRLPAQYHRRWRGSRCCSAWEAVGPLRSNHRESGLRWSLWSMKHLGHDFGIEQSGPARRGRTCLVAIPSGARRRTVGWWSSPRPRRTSPLQRLPAVHVWPLHPVLFRGPYPVNLDERTHLEDGFALRCCQRLSGPDIATRHVPLVG